MGHEMHHPAIRQKPIPPHRDHLQSQLLVWIVGAILLALTLITLHAAFRLSLFLPLFSCKALAISAFFAFAAWKLKAATPAAAAFGAIICLLLTYWTGISSNSILRSALLPLILLFVFTFLATRAGRQHKVRAGLAEPRTGRNAAQIIANLSVSALTLAPVVLSSTVAHTPPQSTQPLPWALQAISLAALIEATADTVSSEIGQAFGGPPILLLTLRRVAPGTDGAITLLGTLAGIASAALIAAIGADTLQLPLRHVLAAFTAGVAGLFFDSLLGATLERQGWLGNNLVNFASTAFSAALATLLLRFV